HYLGWDTYDVVRISSSKDDTKSTLGNDRNTMKRRTGAMAVAIAAAGGRLLSACSTSTTGGSGGDGEGGTLTVGTTDKAVALDPAGAQDNGRSLGAQQVSPFILAHKPGTAERNPSTAETPDLTDP